MTSKEWKKYKLGDICIINMGQSPKSEFYNSKGDGLPFLQGNRTFGFMYPDFDTYTTQITKTAEPMDVIMSVRAPVGELNIVLNKVCIGRGVCSIKIKNGQQKFLYYFMKHYISHLINQGNGTVFGSVNKNDISNLEVLLPQIETQEKIARVLSSLDDKIELNNKINQNLEQQAQAIFKSWFVDFEPFGGKMPEDWSLKTLSDISNITAGGDKPDIVSNIETEECKIPIYSNGIDNNGLYGYTTEPKILQESVTVSARGTIGFTCLRLHPYVPIVRLISLIPRTDIVSAKYLYFSLLNKHITGTGTTQQQLTVPYFKTTPIIVPTFDIVNQFTEIVNSFYKIIEKNICENKRLIQLRDTLLPKLMSGEIDVDKVEVEDVRI